MKDKGFRFTGVRLANFGDFLTLDDCRELINQPGLKTLQTAEPVKDSVWMMLNDHFFAVRPDVELRVYGHYWTQCDLSFARMMSNVRHFTADCLMRVVNIEAIAELPSLEALEVGIYELENFNFLETIPSTLTLIRLGVTRSKKPSLKSLSRFKSLRSLYLEGQSKDIEVIGRLLDLEQITLRSITTKDLTYLAPLTNLWSLVIELGGIRSHKGIEGKARIKNFELFRVRELKTVDIVEALPGLQNLTLDSLPHIQIFPQITGLEELRRIFLDNMKGLHDLSALEFAPALEEFVLSNGKNQIPEQLLPVLKNANVRRVTASFGSERKNAEFKRFRETYGKDAFIFPSPFNYR